MTRISHGSSDYGKRPGRGKATTIRENRLLKRMALQSCRAPSRLLYYQLAEETGNHVSGRTVRRRLIESGVNARRPREKPQLTERHRRLRLTEGRLWMTGSRYSFQMSLKSESETMGRPMFGGGEANNFYQNAVIAQSCMQRV